MPIINTLRHDGITPEILYTTPIHVIGTGGVGSHVVELLTRMQLARPGLYLYDGDVVEAHNPPNQQFTREHIGQSKVSALAKQAAVWSDDQVPLHANFGMVTEPLSLSGIVFLCLDSMAARRSICEQSLFKNSAVKLVIETRMDASLAEVWIFDPNNTVHEQCWLTYWFPDSEAENEVGCGGHYAIPTATSMTANLAVQVLLNHFKEPQPSPTPNRLRLNLRDWRLDTKIWPTTLDQ